MKLMNNTTINTIYKHENKHWKTKKHQRCSKKD